MAARSRPPWLWFVAALLLFLPARLRRGCGRAVVAGGGLLLLVAAAVAVGDDDPFAGGLHPQALALPVVEAVIAISVSLWTMDWFRRRWDRAGPLGRALGRASFAAYLVHPPVVVLLSIALRSVPVPVELKFLAVFAGGVVASFGLGWLATRRPFLARIL